MGFILKGQVAPSTSARRTQIINAINTAVGSRPRATGGFCEATVEFQATNALRLKFRFDTQTDGQAVYDAAVTAATSRAPAGGSYLRLRDAQGAVLAERTW